MKHQKKRRWRSAVCYLVVGVMFMSTVIPAILPPLRSFAAENSYEAKKAAYRAKLKNDDVTTDDLLIGSWVSFYSFEKDSYEYQLDQMAAAGINFNMFPRDFGAGAMYDAEYWNNVEEQYAKRNMIYLMNGNMDAANIAIGVKYAAGKEHCVGYHVVDEPGGAALQGVADIMRQYREADPTRYPYTNLLPSYAGNAWLGGTYREHVERYVALVGAENMEYLSHDFYPFQSRGNNTGIFADMEVLRSVAYENGKLKTHAFPQSTAWNGMRMPNIDEMRWNVYAYLSYGFKALSWFNLVCPGNSDTEGEGFRDSLIYRDGTIRDPELFAAWSELNWEIRGLSDALMNLDTVHAYHTDNAVSGVEYLPADFFIVPDGRAEFVISYMVAKDGTEPYMMLFNKSLRRGADMEFFVDMSTGIEAIEYLDPYTGEYIPMDISEGKLSDSFEIGQGKLYRLKGDFALSETPPEVPSVDLASGLYDGPQTVTITPPVEGAKVYYTLDGSYPTAESTLYEGPITIGKAGEASFHTLRVATVRGASISKVLTRHFVISNISTDGSEAHSLAKVPIDKVLSVGNWSTSGGKISLKGGADDALLNFFIDTSVTYENFHATGHFRFNEGCGSNASAGFFIKASEGDGHLYVGITRGGNLNVYCNGKRIQLPDVQGKTVNVLDGFTLCVTLAGKRLRIEANGQLLSETVSDQFAIQGCVGVNATENGVFTAESVYFTPLASAAPEIQIAMTKVQDDPLTLVVNRGISKEKLLEKLPETAKFSDEEGKTTEYTLTWEMEELDTSSGGTYVLKGYPDIPDGSLTVNPLQLFLRCTLIILHNPDRTELNDAIYLMASLREEDYSPETWAEAEQAYENALGLMDADVPQNAVTVAAVFLMEKINALNPTGIDFTALDVAIASLKAYDLSGINNETRNAVEQILAEAEAFSRTGPVTQNAVNDLVAQLTATEEALKTAETVTENNVAESGCSSAMGTTCAGIILTTGAAVALRKKKETQ